MINARYVEKELEDQEIYLKIVDVYKVTMKMELVIIVLGVWFQIVKSVILMEIV